MEIAEHIAALQRDGQLMAGAARRAGLRAAVPSCPGWQVRDLLRHQGHVHRWAARFVTEGLVAAVAEPTEAEILTAGPPDPGLLDWFSDGHLALVESLRAAPPDLGCWTFLPAPSPLAFWARRQAHETAIHRVDAEQAASDTVTRPSPRFAADGIDELVMGFFGRQQRRLPDEQRGAGDRSVHVRATDTDGEWLLRLTQDGKLVASVRRGGGAADCALAGPAADLYLLLWNRAEAGPASRVTACGDATVLQAWRDGMRVTWH